MSIFPGLAVSFIMNVVMVIGVITAILLILVILIQKGRGGGLSGAFGGGAAGGIMGAKTGDFLTWVTVVMVALFLSLMVIIAKWYRPTYGSYGEEQAVPTAVPAEVDQVPQQPPIPVEEGGVDEDVNLAGG